jgi:asparagine synthase (glutamine-hydrolysing)
VAARFLIENRLDVDSQTFYAEIEQVPAGSAFEVYLDGREKVWSYWSLDDIKQEPVDDPCEAFKTLFEDAVRLRMRSDVPVGICLSGGLDSTSIICSMEKVRTADSRGPVEAFSYISKEYDESRYIEETIRQTGAHLNRLVVDPALLFSKLEKVIWYHDGPVHSMTALVGFELMALAAKAGVKVILNGQGSDETIAGYHSYFGNHWSGMLRKGQFGRVWKEIKQHSASLGGNPYLRFLLAIHPILLDGVSDLSLYKDVAAWKYRMNKGRKEWFSNEFLAHVKREDPPRIRSLEEALKASVQTNPLPLFLRIEDRNSMAHSVEARLPFLDYRLVMLLFTLPSEWKMRGALNKYILRQSMTGSIPETVRTRVDKMGFPVPGKDWIATTLYGALQDVLASRQMRECGMYRVNTIRKDLEAHARGDKDISTSLFNIFQFQMWSNLDQSVAISSPH